MELTKVVPIIKVNIKSDYHLELVFHSGEIKVFDVRPYLDIGVFKQLKNVELFKQAYVAFDTVCWPGNIDIAPETLYRRSVLVSRKFSVFPSRID